MVGGKEVEYGESKNEIKWTDIISVERVGFV